MGKETAVFGGGCFWCTEAIFKRLKGVLLVIPGYAGGVKSDPTYDEVCQDTTGHAEVVKIEFDPKIVSFEKLLDVFWYVHDPTSINKQGQDTGSQYRSIILYTTEKQKRIAEKSVITLEKSGNLQKSVVTEIGPLTKFYPAEEYHRNYYVANPGQSYCQLVIGPKLDHFRQKFKSLLK